MQTQLSPSGDINITDISLNDSSTPVRSNNTEADTSRKKNKCLCGLSDPESTYVDCVTCGQGWHNNCSNLKGLTPHCIRKLADWQCPNCYVCELKPKLSSVLYNDLKAIKKAVNDMSKSNRSVSENHLSLQSEIEELRNQLRVLQSDEVLLPKSSSALESKLSSVSDSMEKTLAAITGRFDEFDDYIHASKNSQPIIDTSCCLPKQPDSMKPNTQSPNIPRVITPCPSHIEYKQDALDDTLKEELWELVKANKANFTPAGDGSRETLYFGEHSYRYTGHEHPAKTMPDALSKLLNSIKPKLSSDMNLNVNSCLISKYQSGSNHIPMHRDDEPVIDPESLILTVSLGAKRTITFMNNDDSVKETLCLEDGSLLVASRYSMDFWKHGILEDKAVETERVSFTFRNIAPHFINSTIVLGDSNTAHINFGVGKGTLGAWMPGKRVKVGHIEALPEATAIGPYRNIVVHTGINSINSQYSRKSDTYLLHFLETRIKEIKLIYPKSKIYLSMVLPTRSRSVNRFVEEFNQGILDFVFNMRGIYIIDNSIFGPILSNEHGRWDSQDNRPMTSDALHLGKSGIRTLAMNIKSTILQKKFQSRDRFNASGGLYRAALGRPNHRDGYQPQG